jgi:large subunit ribosomal protein L32e
MRRHIAAKGRMVKVGYGSNPAEKNIHPCGLRERLVFNVKDLETIKEEAIRISSGVGKRKRAEIKERAEEIGLKVLNP